MMAAVCSNISLVSQLHKTYKAIQEVGFGQWLEVSYATMSYLYMRGRPSQVTRTVYILVVYKLTLNKCIIFNINLDDSRI